MAEIARTQQYNKDVRSWTDQARRHMKKEVLRMVLNIGPGYNNLNTGVRNYHGEASKIQFSFPYYMVFVHKGAGRGYGGSGYKSGKRIINEFTRADGSKGKTNPASLGRMGQGKRKPKPFFNPVIEQRFPELSGIVAEYRGEKVFMNIQRVLID